MSSAYKIFTAIIIFWLCICRRKRNWSKCRLEIMRILFRISWVRNHEASRKNHGSTFTKEFSTIVKLGCKDIRIRFSRFIYRFHVFAQLEEVFISWISQDCRSIIITERIFHHRLRWSIHIQFPRMEVRTVLFIYSFTFGQLLGIIAEVIPCQLYVGTGKPAASRASLFNRMNW